MLTSTHVLDYMGPVSVLAKGALRQTIDFATSELVSHSGDQLGRRKSVSSTRNFTDQKDSNIDYPSD